MGKLFNRQNVTDQDMAIIAMLGKKVTVRWADGERILYGTLQTYSVPMHYFSVTCPNSQWLFTYSEIKEITIDNDIILTI